MAVIKIFVDTEQILSHHDIKMVFTIPCKVTSSWSLTSPPNSPCGTIGSHSSEVSMEPLISAASQREKEEWPTAVGFIEDVLVDDNVGIEFHGLSTIWRGCLGCAGALDILACLFPLMAHRSWHSSKHKNNLPRSPHARTIPPLVADISTFLEYHSATINFIFSFMWFLDAFVVAQTRRAKVLLHEEKARCLGCEDDESSPQPSAKKKWWETAKFVYYRSIFLQLLLLPVGFYYLLFYALDHRIRGGMAHDMNPIYRSIASPMVHDEHNKDNYRHGEISIINPNASVLYAVVHFVYLKVSGSTTRAIQTEWRAFLRKLAPTALWEVLRRAMTNPRQLQLDIVHVQSAIRWIKYLRPLIGTLNKLKANAEDMAVKYRQRQRAKQQKRIRQILWAKRYSTPLGKKDAARIVQQAFRSYQVRKAEHAMMVLQYKKKCLATIKVQRALRNSLKRARVRLGEKKKELLTLREKSKQGRNALDSQEKRRFYHLQDELAQEAQKLINRRLLLRPNTRFAVVWKAIFIFCIVVEISQLLAKPQLDRYKRQRKGKPMTMSEFIAISFIPTRASQRPECNQPKRHELFRNIEFRRKQETHDPPRPGSDVAPWYCQPPGLAIQEAYSDIMSLFLVPAVVDDWPDCRVVKHRRWKRKLSVSKRWFCYEPYRTVHKCYRKIFDFLLEEFLLFVSIVCFLDVFVSFFTGEIDEMTGELVPKPFIARWIIPGLLLQLLVNPELGDVARFLSKSMDTAMNIGLERVLRWSVATLFPVAYFASTIVIKHVWIPLVQYENQLKSFVDDIL